MNLASKSLTSSSNKTAVLLSTIVGISISSAFLFYLKRTRTSAKQGVGNEKEEQKDEEETMAKNLMIEFTKASSRVSSNNSNLDRFIPSKDDQLMLYGLYKQATSGNANSAKQPSRLNVVAYAKHNAWSKFQGMPQDFAMMKYVQVVNHFFGDIDSDNRENRDIISYRAAGGVAGMNDVIASLTNMQDDNDDIVYDDYEDDSNDDLLSEDDEEDDDENDQPVSFSFGAGQQSTLSSSSQLLMEEMTKSQPTRGILGQTIYDHATLLHATTIGDIDMVQKCISNKTNVNARDENGQSALHLAADKGFVECVNVLLQAGADVNAADISGISVLEAAVIGGNKEVIRVMLEAGADPDQEDMDGETPRSCAEDDDDEEIRALLRDAPSVDHSQ